MQGPVVDDDTTNMVRKQGNLHSSLKPSSFVFSFYYTLKVIAYFFGSTCAL